jgi:hypothetical protein
MKRCFWLAALLLVLSGCGGQRHSWHERQILVVETPSGIVSGGSVTEPTASWFGETAKQMSSNAVAFSVKGEASFVEVAPGRYLFALLGDLGAHAPAVFRNNPQEEESDVTARLTRIRETRTVPPALYPRLVTFTDVNNPKTVKLVDPANLAATFGPGFALKAIKLEITGDPVTEGEVEKVLVWLTWSRERLLKFGGGENPVKFWEGELTTSVDTSSFKSGQ